VEAIRVSDGRVLRFADIAGSFGVPLVTYGGTTGGVSHDGKTLVLATFVGPPGADTTTSFAVVGTRNLRLRDVVKLRGMYSFDALAPDASTLYAIQYTSTQRYDRYRVRAYDLKAGKLLPGAIVDKREPKEPMTGSPVARVTNPTGSWVYTLYSRTGDKPFIHALNASNRYALCIDLDAWTGSQNRLSQYTLSLTGGRLVLSRPDGTSALSVLAPG
jgi:hypothetical protein